MVNGSEGIDYWLNQYERPIHPIKENDELQILYAKCSTNKKIPQLEDFELIKVIGRGGFSKVLEVRKKSTAEIYAMKVIKKSFVIEKNKIKEMMVEEQILVKMNHPFIVKLHYAFQNVLSSITIEILFVLGSGLLSRW